MGETNYVFQGVFLQENGSLWRARIKTVDRDLDLQELEESIHQMELARRVLLEAQRKETCENCILEKISKVGGVD